MIQKITRIINDLPASFYLKLFIAAIAFFHVADQMIPYDVISTDLRSYYFAGKAVVDHGNFYDVKYLNTLCREAGINVVFPYLYPPFLAHVIFPISYLPPSHANKIWSLALCIFVAIAAWLAIHLANIYQRENSLVKKSENKYIAFVFAVSLLFILPFRNNVNLGQVNVFLLAFILVSLILFFKKHYRLAAFFLSLSIIIKVTPAILLFYFLVQKQYKVIVYTSLFLILLTSLSIAIGGAESWKWFFRFLPEMSYGKEIEGITTLEHPVYFSITSFIMRVVGKDQQLVSLLTYFINITLFLLIYLQSRKLKTPELLLLPLLILMVIASPVTYLHHFIFILPGLVYFLLYIFYNFSGYEKKLYLGIALLLTLLLSIDFYAYYRSWVGIKLFMFFARIFLFSFNLFFTMLLFVFSLYINNIVIKKHRKRIALPR